MAAVTASWLDAHRVDPATLAEAPLIGIDHVEGEIASLVARLADPGRAERLGAEVPRSILLHGPAGIGKTHTARALARRLGGLPVYEVGADELTAPVVRGLFAALAARHPRSILVIDEIDLVGADRTDADPATRRTLSALLTALDGLQTAVGVLTVAATSQPIWDMDRAAVRAGRLGFTVELLPPDEPTRLRLLEHFLGGRPVAAGYDLASIAAATPGATPADLRALCADAAGLALVAGRDEIAQEDFLAAVERDGHVLPAEPEPEPIDRVRLRGVCVHEAGHLVVGALLHGVPAIAGVEISLFAGEASFDFGYPDGLVPERTERDQVAVALAGAAAESVVFGTLPHGAQRDVGIATGIASRLVDAGVVPGLPPNVVRDRLFDGTRLRDRAVEAVAGIVLAERDTAHAMAAKHLPAVAALAERLEAQVLPRLSEDPRRQPVALDVGAVRRDVASALAGSPRSGRTRRRSPTALEVGPEAVPALAGNGRSH